MRIVFLQNGQMGYMESGKAHALTSQRIRQYTKTLESLEEKYAWKTQGAGAQFMNQSNPYAGASGHADCRVTAVVADGARLIYAVDLNRESGGLYVKDLTDPDAAESMIVSDRYFDLVDLVSCGDSLFGALGNVIGQRHIVRLSRENGRRQQLTEGDSYDRHPFMTADGKTLYFDTAGNARNDDKIIVGRSPSEIVALTIENGEINTVLADPQRNYYKFAEARDGTRYVMIRPYNASRANSAKAFGCLTAPFSAIAGFIRFFSDFNDLRKGKKPPAPSVATGAAPAANERVSLDGVMIDAGKTFRENERSGDAYPGIAPRDWVLARVAQDGACTELQHGVVDYALLRDGGYIFTNGMHIMQVDPSGETVSLGREKLITAIAPPTDE